MENNQGIVSLFIVIIGGFSLFTFFLASFNLRKLWKEVQELTGIVKGIKNRSLENLVLINDQVQQSKLIEIVAADWEDYYEVASRERQQTNGLDLENYLDPVDFLGSETLIRKHSNRNLANAVPSILTGMGILGTFVGLVVGLANLNNMDVNQLKTAIPVLIGGLRISFIASLSAVLCSIAWSLADRYLLQKVEQKTDTLITQLYKVLPIRNESSLLEMIVLNQATQYAQIRENIGEIGDLTKDFFNEALEQTLVAFNTISNNNQTVMTKALEEVKTTITDGLTGIESKIKTTLDATVATIGQTYDKNKDLIEQTLSATQTTITGTLTQMETKITETLNTTQETVKTTTEHSTRLISNAVTNSSDKIATALEKNQTEITNAIQNDLTPQITAMNNAFTKHVEELTESQIKAVEDMVDRIIQKMDQEFGGQLKQFQIDLQLLIDWQNNSRDALDLIIKSLQAQAVNQTDLNSSTQTMLASLQGFISQLGIFYGKLDGNIDLLKNVSGQLVDLEKEITNKIKQFNQSQTDLEKERQKFDTDISDKLLKVESLWTTIKDTFTILNDNLSKGMEKFAQDTYTGLNNTFTQFDQNLAEITVKLGEATMDLNGTLNDVHKMVMAIPQTFDTLVKALDDTDTGWATVIANLDSKLMAIKRYFSDFVDAINGIVTQQQVDTIEEIRKALDEAAATQIKNADIEAMSKNLEDLKKVIVDIDSRIQIGDTSVQSANNPVQNGSGPIQSGSNPIQSGSSPIQSGNSSIQSGNNSA